MDSNTVFLAVTIAVLIWFYRKFFNTKDSLDALGIAHDKPLPIVGNTLPIITKRQNFVEFGDRLYDKFCDKKVYGFYSFLGDYTVVVSDPLIVKQIMVKDFEYFVNRDRVDPNKVDKLLGKSILMLRDQKWKDMRSTLSPVYTSSKMKQMFGLLQKCIADFMNLYEEKASKAQGEVLIDTHEVLARVTADGIATTALGFDGDCITNKDSEIFKIAVQMEADFQNPNSLIFLNIFPGLCKFLGIEIFRKTVHQFFEKNVLGEIKRRQASNIHRPDVIELLIQAKNGKLKSDNGDGTDETLANKKPREPLNWSDEDLVAQALVFFLGGFDTTSTLMQSYFWELTQNPEVQQTLINEVDEMLESLDGKRISYEQLNEMKYLDMVINETLRKWPSFRITSRLCSKDYTIKTDDGRQVTIKQGFEVFIPIGSIQRDPQYFEDPETFNPSRFSDENKKNIKPGTFLPFGSGPRICIGSRYAILKAKLMLFTVLTMFRIEKCEETPEKLIFSDGTSGYAGKVFVSLKLRNRESS